MNGESRVIVAETAIFPMAEKEVSEGQNLIEKEDEKKIVVKAVHINETRFARLKKSLRKRSASIL
jgi:hemerythrin-like domain-containing protein